LAYSRSLGRNPIEQWSERSMAMSEDPSVPTLSLGSSLSGPRNGSAEALGQLLESCRAYLLRIANSELDTDLRAKGGASDLVQQTFLEAQNHFNRFEGTTQRELQVWLREILRNNVHNFRRDFREVGKREVRKEVPLYGPGRDLVQELAARGPSPSSHLIHKEQEELVRRVLSRLPENYRRAIELRQREQCTFEMIGERLGCSAEAARKLWLRGLERLQEELAHDSDL
jgi:RNA polymerase sigma-70 factor (ECF subfamily)